MQHLERRQVAQGFVVSFSLEIKPKPKRAQERGRRGDAMAGSLAVRIPLALNLSTLSAQSFVFRVSVFSSESGVVISALHTMKVEMIRSRTSHKRGTQLTRAVTNQQRAGENHATVMEGWDQYPAFSHQPHSSP